MRGPIDQVRNWVGKTVICVAPEKETSPYRKKQLEIGKSYRVKRVSVGNYDAFVYLEGFPDKIYVFGLDTGTGRYITNCFNARAFVLAEWEGEVN